MNSITYLLNTACVVARLQTLLNLAEIELVCGICKRSVCKRGSQIKWLIQKKQKSYGDAQPFVKTASAAMPMPFGVVRPVHHTFTRNVRAARLVSVTDECEAPRRLVTAQLTATPIE